MNASQPSRCFPDTNIFVYAYDIRDKRKHQIAQDMLEQFYREKSAVISTQIIQEFCNVMRKKKVIGLTIQDMDVAIDQTLKPFLAHRPSVPFYHRALELLEHYSLSVYDALLVQAALDLDCARLYSEDLQAGQRFGKLVVINPFEEKV
jgi:predicted nucleic acid-binding protein